MNGLLFQLTPTAGTAGGSAQVAFDAKALDDATGGVFSQRGRLVSMPACALTMPQLAACTTPTPVATHSDPATGRVVADVTVPSGAAVAAVGRSSMASPRAVQAASAPLVLALTSTASGGGGDYTASSLNPSSGWAAGSAGGGMSYGYDIQLPASVGGSTPGVALSYSSSSVDGKTSATNAQASWIGDGWDYNPGFIERTYQSCDKHGIPGSGDECWAGDNATLSLGSHSGQLVRDDVSHAWHLKSDDGTKIEFLAGANNGVNNGEYVKVTDTSGTVYFFGANYLPKADGTMQTMGTASQSVSNVPVYSPNTTDPCYNAAQGAASWCQMASRWALDYVIDPHGNLSSYTYKPEQGNYARGGGQNNGNGALTPYTRANLLYQISYGQRQDEQLAAGGALQPAAHVTFGTDERCIADKTFSCDPSLRAANAWRWYDVPVDQECPASGTCTNYSPTYFTTRRLTKISTQVRANNAWADVDSYVLSQSFPPPGDGSSQRALWLDQIQRTGMTAATTVPLPPVSFVPVMLPNRVDGITTATNGAGFPDINRPRIQQIRNETGAILNIDYNLPGCSRLKNVMPAAEDNNQMSCFPVKWTPPGAIVDSDPIVDWFNHYTVHSIALNDPTTVSGLQITQQTAYAYGKPAWHHDDSEYTDSKTRTWSDFRGYSSVTTVTGNGADGPMSQTVTTYLQGMDGDRTTGADRSVTVPDALGEKVTDDDWLAGEVLQTDTYDQADGTITATITNRTTSPVTTATHARTGDTTLAVPLVARYAGTTTATTTRSLKADKTWRTTTRTTQSDSTHNNRQTTSLEQADGLPDLCNITGYATGPDPQRTDLVDHVTAVSGSSPCTATATSANTVSDSQILYDNQPFGQAASTADATSSQLLDSYDGSGKPHYIPQHSAGFDKYGRTTSTTVLTNTDRQHPGGATTRTTYTPAAAGEQPATVTVSAPIPGSSTTATWDTVSTYDVRRGVALTVTDPNLKTVSEAYDALGRLTSVWSAGRTTAQSPNRTFAYTLDLNRALPGYVTSRSLVADPDPLYTTSVQISDGLGRPRQGQANTAFSGITGRLISDTFYDSHGRAFKTNAPWYNADAGPGGTLVVPNTTPQATDDQIPAQTVSTFDGQSRALSSTFVSMGVPQWSTFTAYPGADRTDVTPPSGAWPTSTVTDARGRTTELWQYSKPTPTGNPADATVTRYTYQPDGKPDTRVDAAGNTWSYGYDLLGRQTSATDPDTGTTLQTYDNAGNLATTTDARSKTLAYTYDLIGRKIGEYAGSVSPANQLAGWAYDTVAKGHPSSSTRYVGGASGSTYTTAVTKYDNSYRATSSTVTIPGSEIGQTGSFSYTTSSGYDRFTGNLNYTLLPAVGGLPAETASNTYDAYGLLIQTAGKVTYDLNTGYDAFGRPQRTTVNPWGKQVVSSTVYDQATGQVLHDYVDKQTAQTGQTQITNYTYNPAGQLTSITGIPDNTPSATDRQCFTYDSLGRLSTAWTDTGTVSTPDPAQHMVMSQGACTNSTPTSGVVAPSKTTVGGGSPYWQDYQYDVTGNRKTLVQHNPGGDTSKDVTTTQTFPTTPNTKTTARNTGGGTGGPHALLSASTVVGAGTPTVSTSQFDEAGNTTSVTDTSGTVNLTWDGEDKLASVAKTGQSPGTTYIYDADGNQLIRHDPGKTTVNLGSDELTYDTNAKTPPIGTRYYAMPNGITDVRVGGGGLVAQIADHQGTDSLSIDLTTSAESRRPTDPFGNPRGTQPTPGSWVGDKGFVGGTKDDTTGLTNLGAREYDPVHGRFLNPDPLLDATNPQQWNGYAYSDNSPISKSDPSGMMAEANQGGGDNGTVVATDDGVIIVDPTTGDRTDDGPGNGGHGGGGGNGGGGGAKTKKCGGWLSGGGFSCHVSNGVHRTQHFVTQNPVVKIIATTVTYGVTFTSCWGAATAGASVSGGATLVAAGIGCGALAGAASSLVDNALTEGADHSFTGQLKDVAAGAVIGGATVGAGEVAQGAAASISSGVGKNLLNAVGDLLGGGGGGGCRLNSFLTGTLVQLANGQAKPIDQLAEGDQVLATDPQTGTTTAEPITQTIVTPDDKDFTDLTLTTHLSTGGTGRPQSITSTAHHPYWDATTHRWTEAAGLKVGDELALADGTTAVITSSHSYTTVPTAAYNLTVADLHTYYVLAGTTPVLVHNAGCDPYQIPLDENGLPVGGHTSGTARPPWTGGTPNSVYTRTGKDGTPVQNTIFDGNGDAAGHFDFKDHGTGGPHGHVIDPPGTPGGGHGSKAPHIPAADLPPGWNPNP
ncbi:polymorphic toxin-type HINT domain-containing protein [Kitasatospora sp. MAP5-34]|uniref:polymorphic toxin-type HINT domain-containing protein n=1 Tax=Kitasatospora sp. MAP5-34 TaxID=3035102 RepID=UPI002475B741|nr:polymorphic toxin-type HINT domain-containing protein [Kitasatospora sp. MAP5-34]